MTLTDQQRAELKAALTSQVPFHGRQQIIQEGCLALLADLEEAGAEREEIAHAVRWAPSSAHWSCELERLLGKDAREGIAALEKRLRDTREELSAVRQQLAEAQACAAEHEAEVANIIDAALQGPCHQMLRNAIDVAMSGERHALQSAIEQAIAPYKRDAERLDWLESQDCWIGLKEEMCGVRPVIAAGGAFSDSVRSSIDAALSAKEKSNEV